jgi:hypothetical protein
MTIARHRTASSTACAPRKLVRLDGEDASDFRGGSRALEAELAPAGGASGAQAPSGRARSYLESAGAADPDPRAALAAGVARDNYGPRVLARLVRYRGSVLAELFRMLAAPKLLQTGAPCRPKPRRHAAGGRQGRSRTNPGKRGGTSA